MNLSGGSRFSLNQSKSSLTCDTEIPPISGSLTNNLAARNIPLRARIPLTFSKYTNLKYIVCTTYHVKILSGQRKPCLILLWGGIGNQHGKRKQIKMRSHRQHSGKNQSRNVDNIPFIAVQSRSSLRDASRVISSACPAPEIRILSS